MPTAEEVAVDYSQGQDKLEAPDANTMRIMLSTDNHLGYEESDTVRGMDSFAAFEEVLYLAKRYQCDMVLIAGDIFHENRPSRQTLYKTMEIIRRYAMGHDPVRIQILSDDAAAAAAAVKNFRNLNGVVNYEDEHYAVDLPIFAIHGNHDDPTRDGGDLLAALDLLAMSNLVNYFGCQEEVSSVKISPVLLAKGTTQIALYGLGSMRDERLNRMWREGKVGFLRPQEDKGSSKKNSNNNDASSSSDDDNDMSDNDDDDDDPNDDDEEEDGFFNLFTLHQNRDLGRGTKNCVQEAMIPEWMDLVVWGHEHECQIDFVESIVGTFRITQPGSSVATSLIQGEAVRKKVGILDINGKNFRLHPVPLTQVRSFVTTELSLREHRSKLDPEDNNIESKVARILEEEVNVMVVNAREKMDEVHQEAEAAGSNAGDDKESPLTYKILNPERVLVRLRVEHSGFSSMNNQRFGAKFVEEVANSDNILLFHRKKAVKEAGESKATKKARAAMSKPIEPEELERTNVEDLVSGLLELPNQKLKLLTEDAMSTAMEDFVDKNISSAIPETTTTQLMEKQKTLLKNKDVTGAGKESVLDAVEQESQENEEMEASKKSSKKKTKKRGSSKSTQNDEDNDASFEENVNAGNSLLDDDDDDDDDEPKSKAKPRSRSSSARSGSKSTTARKTGRRRKHDDDDDDDDVEVVEPPPKARSRRTAKKKVNYSLDDSGDDDDDDDDSDAAMMDLDGDDDDDEVLEVDGDDLDDDSPPKKSKSRSKATAASRSKATTAASRKRAPAARTLSGTAKSRAKSSSSRGKNSSRSSSNNKSGFDSDSNDDAAGGGGGGGGGAYGGSSSMTVDADWGSAITRSQQP